MEKHATGPKHLLDEAEAIAAAAWTISERFSTDPRLALSSALDHDVVPLRARRIADHLYRLNGRTGLWAWLDYLPFGTVYLKWSLPGDIEVTADGAGYQVPPAAPVGTPIRLPDEAAQLARKALAHPDVEEVAVFTETTDPILAVRLRDGTWYEILRWE